MGQTSPRAVRACAYCQATAQLSTLPGLGHYTALALCAGLPDELHAVYLDFISVWNTNEAPWSTPSARRPSSTLLREHSATSLDGRQHSILVSSSSPAVQGRLMCRRLEQPQRQSAVAAPCEHSAHCCYATSSLGLRQRAACEGAGKQAHGMSALLLAVLATIFSSSSQRSHNN